jgi:hypothetical protein
VTAPIRRVAFQSGRGGARLTARWIGQDGHDFVGPGSQAQPSDVEDVHIELAGLDPRREVVFVDVTGDGGDQWRFEAHPLCWRAELVRNKAARTADLFVEPSRIETGRNFHVVLRYDDGATETADFRGRKADPNLRMASAALAARWIGQDGHDRSGTGPSVGPDGFQDVRIHLSRLSPKVAVKALRIEGPSGARWEFGTNPKLFPNAELVRDPKDPSQADLFFQPLQTFASARITVKVAYENEKLDTTTVNVGRCDPELRMPQTPLPELTERGLKAEWLGQDGQNPVGPGDVHVVISGLPASWRWVAAELNDSVIGAWMYRESDRIVLPADPWAASLVVKLRSDRHEADLFFTPYRDEANATFTLRLIAADGRNLLVRFPGERCDISRTAPRPELTRVVARPGDDIQALVDRFGTVVLAAGTYHLRRPLVLSRAVTLTAEGGVTLLFEQASSEPAWTTAIRIRAGNTTLNGFAVRFAGPVRWNNDTSWGPAVIGMADQFDTGSEQPIGNVTIKRLDLEIPPIEPRPGWIEALRLMRLARAKSGVVAENRLRGGPIEFLGGPWKFLDNDFRGTIPGTFSHGVFEGHGTHDVVIRGNKTAADPPSGKTWRFLVLTWFGANDVIEHNTIEGLGARDDDTIPWSNEPEIIVTEAYHLRYEGKVMALSDDRRLLRTGALQGGAVRTGEVVSILNGPAAGQWRRIAQVIDATTFLVDPPMPAGSDVVSISTGFVSELFQENRIDIRAGRKSDCLAFIGNHFGTRVLNNHLRGGAHAFRMTACPSETPVVWGWSHVPFLDGVVEGNILEDAESGGELGLEHDPRYIKSNRGRIYMTVRVSNNVIKWSDPFLRRCETRREKTTPIGLTLGYDPCHDTGELVVTARDNRLESSASDRLGTALLIRAADYNSQRITHRKLTLPAGTSAAAPARMRPAPDPGARR